ncbi:MAG: hypothetical protein SFW62_04160 [Alphaproteobacteria bacterium]|nr:hypothetical protein [Alphaproteobacteria bacterium]
MNSRLSRLLLLVFTIATLNGCISGVREPDAYVSPVSGEKTLIENNREMCTRSCNQDYSRCMDTGSAQGSGVIGPSGMFGASADCRRDLRGCLSDCNAR